MKTRRPGWLSPLTKGYQAKHTHKLSSPETRTTAPETTPAETVELTSFGESVSRVAGAAVDGLAGLGATVVGAALGALAGGMPGIGLCLTHNEGVGSKLINLGQLISIPSFLLAATIAPALSPVLGIGFAIGAVGGAMMFGGGLGKIAMDEVKSNFR